MNIPDKAIRDAMQAIDDRMHYLGADTADTEWVVATAIKAAAPFIAAQAYDDGADYGLDVANWEQFPGEHDNPGPYRNPYEEQE